MPEALGPPGDRDVVDLNAALDQQLLDVAVGLAMARIPAHSDHDHLRREQGSASVRGSTTRPMSFG